MESTLVSYEIKDSVATIVMDDGKQNLISPKMIQELNHALDEAEKQKALVLLTGRENVFCAGFDLKILKSGVRDAFQMLTGGFELGARLLSFPTPVVIACNGHAIAMGAFLLLSGDYRIGAKGSFKIVTNEVAIGLTMPSAGVEICRQRLNPSHFTRAALLAKVYTPDNDAIEAGFLDQVVSSEDLFKEARELVTQLKKLDLKAHYETKLRLRHQSLKLIKRAIQSDRIDFINKGVKRVLKNIFQNQNISTD